MFIETVLCLLSSLALLASMFSSVQFRHTLNCYFAFISDISEFGEFTFWRLCWSAQYKLGKQMSRTPHCFFINLLHISSFNIIQHSSRLCCCPCGSDCPLECSHFLTRINETMMILFSCFSDQTQDYQLFDSNVLKWDKKSSGQQQQQQQQQELCVPKGDSQATAAAA